MMRMAGAVTVAVLIIEALLAGAFALGFYWLGGFEWGLLFSGVMLLLIVLPWLGELKVVFDSCGPRGGVKVGWWGRASFVQREDVGHLVVRVLGIPIRRTMGAEGEEAEPEAPSAARPPPPEPELEPATEEGPAEERAAEPSAHEEEIEARDKSWWKQIDSETVEGFCRVIGSALGATCELVWGAEEIRVSVQDPAEHATADALIAEVFGRREVGPADVALSIGPGERRVRAIYRIGLLRAALAGVQVMIDGRVRKFAKQMKSKKQKACAEAEEDRRIIEEIVEQSEQFEEDEA
jgi:hypothetical protein